MSKAIIKVYFHYGDKTFDELFKKIVYEKLLYFSLNGENMDKVCCSKNNRATAIYQDTNKVNGK